MSKTNRVMTADQTLGLSALVKDGRRFDTATLNPYTGVLTASRDWDSVMIEPDGRVVYDSAAPTGTADADGREIRPGLAVWIDSPDCGSICSGQADSGRIHHHLEGDSWCVRLDSGAFVGRAAHECGQPMGGEVDR